MAARTKGGAGSRSMKKPTPRQQMRKMAKEKMEQSKKIKPGPLGKKK